MISTSSFEGTTLWPRSAMMGQLTINSVVLKGIAVTKTPLFPQKWLSKGCGEVVTRLWSNVQCGQTHMRPALPKQRRSRLDCASDSLEKSDRSCVSAQPLQTALCGGTFWSRSSMHSSFKRSEWYIFCSMVGDSHLEAPPASIFNFGRRSLTAFLGTCAKPSFLPSECSIETPILLRNLAHV